MRIKIEEMKKICIDVLQRSGFDHDDSETILNEYLYGELTGKRSHGIASFHKFATENIGGRKEGWDVVKEDDSYALIDGKGNPGQLVGKFAMELAISKAKVRGIALIGMNNMKSFLMPGYYAKMAADRDMIGLVVDNAKSTVAPFGGIEPRLGTNPIGLAIPNKGHPFVLDMATSTRAMGEVRLAKKSGDSLPDGMALDKEGNMTKDPADVNALLPFGGYKGYGLGLAIEMLAGSLVRAKMGSKIESNIDRGFLFIVIDPKIFTDMESFKEEVSAFIDEVKSSEKAEGCDEILIPGERASHLMKENIDKGYIDIEDKVVEEIKRLL